MTSYDPPKKGATYTTYVSLISQANTKIMQANPTLAAGDVKLAIDDGAPANLATLPVVDADFTKRVKVDLSTSETNGDNITIIFSDVAGAEWCDLVLNLQTTTRQFDDLAYPTVSGRSLDVTATGAAGIDWANVENPTTAVNLSATNIDVDQVVASVSGAVGSVTVVSDKTGYSLSAAGVQAIWDALTSALTTVGSIGKLLVDNVNATISSRSTVTTAQVNAEVLDVLNVDTFAEPSSVPAATTTIQTMLHWLFTLARNKRTTTSTTDTLRNDADNATIAASTISDDGTTFTRGEYT